MVLLGSIVRMTWLVAAEPGVDLIAVYENVDLLIAFMSRPMADAMNEIVAKAGRKYDKPVIVVSPPGTLDKDRLEVESKLSEAGTAVFPSMDRAAKAIANVRQYCRMHADQGSK